jgi:hypothetical protein
MKNSQRVMVYLIGFILGSLLVSMILSRRASKGEAAIDPWVTHNTKAVAGGAESLPHNMPASIQKGANYRLWLLYQI